MSKSYFEFVRAADKLMEEWDGLRRADIVHHKINSLVGFNPPSGLLPLIESMELKHGEEQVEMFRVEFNKFRKKYAQSIDLAEALNLLDLCEPVMRDHVSKRINPDSPITITSKIRALLERRHGGIDDIRSYRRLISLYEKALQTALEGKDPKKTKAKIAEGRALLGLD